MRFFNYGSEKKRDSILNLEWKILGGGFCHLGMNNWTFCHRFAAWGNAAFGTEQEFVVRFQLALDADPRFSWLTLELWNAFEARWVYFWLKVWKNRNLKIVFNLGPRLTRASRDYLDRQALEYERRKIKEMAANLGAVKNNGGGFNASVIR